MRNEIISSEILRCLTDYISTGGRVQVTKQGLHCVPCGKWFCTLKGLFSHFTGQAHKNKADEYETNGIRSPPPENQYENWYGKCYSCDETMRVGECVDNFNDSEHRKSFENFQQKALPADDCIRRLYCLQVVDKVNGGPMKTMFTIK